MSDYGAFLDATPDAVAAALESVRERHRARTNDPTTTSITVCDDCEQLWPCDISVIVAVLVPAATPPPRAAVGGRFTSTILPRTYSERTGR